MDASPQESVTKSSSKLDKETQGEDAESCSCKDRPISEETSKQSTSTSDQKGKLIGNYVSPDKSDHITASPCHEHKKKIHKACKIKLFLVLNGVFYHERCLFKEHSRQPLRV